MGIIGHSVMCGVDLALWAVADSSVLRDQVVRQLMDHSTFWITFMIVGPTLFYAGLATYAWPHLRQQPLASVLALVGSFMVGTGHFLFHSHLVVLIGAIAMAVGMGMLVLRGLLIPPIETPPLPPPRILSQS